MANVIVIGSQWGDEGKGKLVDILAEQAGIVVRFQGGNNAGHTVMFQDKTFILHLIPSGITHPNKRCAIGNGVVVDSEALLAELDKLKDMGVDSVGRMFISDIANLIMPWHKVIDQAREARLKDGKIGTTGRGIGPCYEDKVSRQGIRFIDIEDTAEFKKRIEDLVVDKNATLKHVLGYTGELLDAEAIYKDLMVQYGRIKAYLTDTQAMIADAMKDGEHVLFEGAQGTFLDIDHGTYPFVTSSNTVSGGACTGAGVAPTKIDRVAGVVKAYTTRVGSGPFPTELFDAAGEELARVGKEFGATTGRPRRCGWFDACLLKESVEVNGLTDLAITKMDVLDGLDEIKICVGYEDKNGNKLSRLPHKPSAQLEVVPVYETLPGWKSSTRGLTEYDLLPQKAKDYVKRIEDILEVPVFMISTGPKREETITLTNVFSS